MSTEISREFLSTLAKATPARIAAALLVLKGEMPQRSGAAAEAGPLIVGPAKAARLLGISRTTLWRMTREGRIPTVEILPGCHRIRRCDIERLAGLRP